VRHVLSPKFKSDLEEIADWIAQDNPRRALKVLDEICTQLRKIAQNPMHYQVRPEIGEDARLAVVGRYVVLFWIDDAMVRFERVAYGAAICRHYIHKEGATPPNTKRPALRNQPKSPCQAPNPKESRNPFIP
jgi:toxin ParE1/3/4